jgi:high-affinity iron transporter
MKKLIQKLLFAILLSTLLPCVSMAQQGVTENYVPVVAEIIERGDKAIEIYTVENSVLLGNEFSRLYFDVFEGSGMEFTLGLKDQSFMLSIESGFSEIISLGMRGGDAQRIQDAWFKLRERLKYAAQHYSNDGEGQSFWGLVFQAFLILFREGIEAMLVVAALATYLRRSGYAEKVRVIWHGVGWAILASVVAAWLLTNVINLSGAGRENIEGLTMLIAAAVLIYVSFWLFAKRESERWQAFIKGKMDQALLASGSISAISVGAAFAAVLLLLVFFIMRFASIRLPLGVFFSFTAVLLFLMAFVFTGKGLLELQVSNMVPTTRIDGVPQVGWLGIFPTRETLLGQAAILLLLPAGWIWLKFRNGLEVKAS